MNDEKKEKQEDNYWVIERRWGHDWVCQFDKAGISRVLKSTRLDPLAIIVKGREVKRTKVRGEIEYDIE